MFKRPVGPHCYRFGSRETPPHSRHELRCYPAPFSPLFQSGSQNDLCDTWTPEEEKEAAASFTTSSRTPRNTAVTSAEYPFHANVCMPPQGINFDLTHKRGKLSCIFLICYGSRVVGPRGPRVLYEITWGKRDQSEICFACWR